MCQSFLPVKLSNLEDPANAHHAVSDRHLSVSVIHFSLFLQHVCVCVCVTEKWSHDLQSLLSIQEPSRTNP